MNNMVTVVSSGQINKSSMEISTSGDASVDGLLTLQVSSSEAEVASFQYVIQKSYDNSTPNEQIEHSYLDGNNMPLSPIVAKLPEKDGRSSLQIMLNPAEKISIKDNAIEIKTERMNQLSASDNNADVIPLNQLSSSLSTESKINFDRENDESLDREHSLSEVKSNVRTGSDNFPKFTLSDVDSPMSVSSVVIDKMLSKNKLPLRDVIANSKLSKLASGIENKNSAILNQSLSPLQTDTTVNVEGESRMLPSRMYDFLKVVVTSDKKDLRPTTNQHVQGRIQSTNISMGTALIQSSEGLQLKVDQLEVINNNSQLLTNTTNQQHILPTIQAALLSKMSSSQNILLETNIDGLPTITSTAVNNLSLTNSQVMPQGAIAEAFGRPTWSQGMGKQILWMVNQNIGSAEIRLNPAHLGPIEILIDMSEDQVNVSLTSRHAAVREAMEQALPKLREMLDENGFSLADTNISKQSFAEQQEQNTGDAKRNIIIDHNDEFITTELSGNKPDKSSLVTSTIDYYI